MEHRQRVALLLTPPSLWLTVFFLVPLGIMVVFSFRAGSFGAERELFTLDNYRQFLSDGAAQRLLWRSAGMAFQMAAVCILLAYPLAYFLSFQAGRARLTLLTVLVIPAWTSFLLRILAWKVILGSPSDLHS